MIEYIKIPYEKVNEWRIITETISIALMNDKTGVAGGLGVSLSDVALEISNELKAAEEQESEEIPLEEPLTLADRMQHTKSLSEEKPANCKICTHLTGPEHCEKYGYSEPGTIATCSDMDEIPQHLDTIPESKPKQKPKWNCWTSEELALVKCAKTADEAKYDYKKEYGDKKRSPSAVEQCWRNLKKDGELLNTGDRVTVNRPGNTYHGKQGNLTKIHSKKEGVVTFFEVDSGKRTDIVIGLGYLTRKDTV